jgi:hypothetical protein
MRLKIKGEGARKPSSPETEPNFYALPYLPPSDGSQTAMMPSTPRLGLATGLQVSMLANGSVDMACGISPLAGNDLSLRRLLTMSNGASIPVPALSDPSLSFFQPTSLMLLDYERQSQHQHQHPLRQLPTSLTAQLGLTDALALGRSTAGLLQPRGGTMPLDLRRHPTGSFAAFDFTTGLPLPRMW